MIRKLKRRLFMLDLHFSYWFAHKCETFSCEISKPFDAYEVDDWKYEATKSLLYFLWSRNDYLDFNEYGRENGVGEVVLSGIYLVAIHLAIYVFSFLPNVCLMWMFFLRIIGNSIAFFIFAIYFQVFFNEILKI